MGGAVYPLANKRAGGGVAAAPALNGLSVRWHACPGCGASLQRDHNAALNTPTLGKQQSAVGPTAQASTWPGGASVA
jgi:transposase